MLLACLLYTSDAADERSSVDLGGRRIIKKKKREESVGGTTIVYTKWQNYKRTTRTSANVTTQRVTYRNNIKRGNDET